MFGLGTIRDMTATVRLSDKVTRPLGNVNRALDRTKTRMGSLGTAIQKNSGGLIALGSVLTGVGALTGVMASRTIGLERVMQEMQARTAASDVELQHLGKTLQNLAKVNSNSFQEIGGAITVLRQRWGALGATMQPVAQTMLDFAKITGTDAVQAADSISVAMKAFGMDVSQASDATDLFLAVWQRYGVDAARMAELIKDNGAALKLLGLDMGKALGLLAAMESQGVNVSRVLMGLRQAAAKGIDIDKTLEDLAKIEDSTLRTKKATEIFGSYAGPGISKVLEDGIEGLEKFNIKLEDVRGVTKKASKDIDQSLSEQLGILRNNIALVVAELGKGLIPVLKPISKLVKGLAQAFIALPGPVKTALSVFTALIAVVVGIGGPLLIFLGLIGLSIPALNNLAIALRMVKLKFLSTRVAVLLYSKTLAAANLITKLFSGALGLLRIAAIGLWTALGPIGIGLIALGSVLTTLWFKSDKFREVVTSLGKGLRDSLGKAAEWVGSKIQWLIDVLTNAYERIKPFLSIVSFMPGVGGIKLATDIATHGLLPSPKELTSTAMVSKTTTIDQRKSIGKIEIKVEGAGDPDKVAEKVVKKIERQFMGM